MDESKKLVRADFTSPAVQLEAKKGAFNLGRTGALVLMALGWGVAGYG